MPAVSKKQQKFFGIVRAIQKGEMAPTTPETAKAAADMKKGDVKKFASTKHKGLPEKKKIEEDRQVKKIIKQLRKSVKSHKKQADTLEKKVKTFKESNFSNITVGNKVGQTFQHTSGATITLDGALGGKMMVPSQVTLDLGLDGFFTVDGPTESDFGLAGFTKPLDLKLQKRIADQSVFDMNSRLLASKTASGAPTARITSVSQKGFGGGQSNETNRRGSGFSRDSGIEGGMTYSDVTDRVNAIGEKYGDKIYEIQKKLDALPVDNRPNSTYVHPAVDGLVKQINSLIDAQNKEEQAVYDEWDAYNKQPNPDLNLPQDVPDSARLPGDTQDVPDTETSTEKAIKNLIGHIGGYQAGGPKRGEIVGHVVDRGMFVVDTYLKELSNAEKTFTASLDKMTKEYKALKKELDDSDLSFAEKNKFLLIPKKNLERERDILNHIKQDSQDLKAAKPQIRSVFQQRSKSSEKTYERNRNNNRPTYDSRPLPANIDLDQLDPTQKFAMRDLGYGPAMTDLGIERKSPSGTNQIGDTQGEFMPSNPPGMRQQRVSKPTGLSRVLGGTVDALTGGLTDFDQRGGKPFGLSKVAAGAVDAMTGNRTDFDKMGSTPEVPTGLSRFAGGFVDQITGNRTDFDRQGGEKFNPIVGAKTKIYGGIEGFALAKQVNQVIQKHKKDIGYVDTKPTGVLRIATGTLDRLTNNKFDFDQRGDGNTPTAKDQEYAKSQIKLGDPGSFTNPIINPVSFYTKKKFIQNIDVNDFDKDIATQMVELSADAFHKATGMKVTHSLIPGELGEQEYNIVVNDKGGIEKFDNYKFSERGYEYETGTGLAKMLGGPELQKDVATMYDKAGPVGALTHRLLGDISDRQDPPVRFKTVWTKEELIKSIGQENYEKLINRLNTEKENRDKYKSSTPDGIPNHSNLGLIDQKLSVSNQTSDTFASVTPPQQTFSQMQQRIQNAFSNNTQTNTDAPSRDELLNDLDRRRTTMQNKYDEIDQLTRERDNLYKQRIYGEPVKSEKEINREKKIQALDDKIAKLYDTKEKEERALDDELFKILTTTPDPLIPRDPTIKIGKVGTGVYDLSKTYNDTGSPDTPLTQPSALQDSGEAGYNKLKGKVPNLPSWSNLGSAIELPNTPKPPSGTLDAQGYNDANDAWTYDEYMKQYYALMDRASDEAEPIEIEKMKYSPTGYKGVKKTYTPKWAGGSSVEPPSLTDALNVINDKLVKALDALTKRWEAYNDAIWNAMQRGLAGGGSASTPPSTGGQMKGGQGGRRLGSTTQRQGGAYNPRNPYGTGLDRSDSSFKKNKKQKGMKESKLSFELIQQFREESNPRIPRKKGQPANSKKHSDLYTDENPKGTIHGLGFKDVATSKASVSKIRNSSRSHAHKIQAAVAMEQRAREMGKTSEAAVYRKYINSMKKKTKKMNEAANPAQQAAIAISMKKKGIKPKNLKEQIQFAQMQQRIRDAKEKRREQQKKSEKLYMDTKKKGVKFYDKKGSGRLKDGKKIYD